MDLDAVISTHRQPIERHLRRRVGDLGLAEDLTQEVFLRAWLHAPRDLPEPRMRAWLYRVAGNIAIDTLRARRPLLDPSLIDALGEQAAAEAEDHAERLAIEAALAALSARDRALVALQLAGYGPTDAARLLGTTPEAARKRLTRAVARFRRAYAGADEPQRPLVLLLARDEEPELYERWLAGAEVRVRLVRARRKRRASSPPRTRSSSPVTTTTSTRRSTASSRAPRSRPTSRRTAPTRPCCATRWRPACRCWASAAATSC